MASDSALLTLPSALCPDRGSQPEPRYAYPLYPSYPSYLILVIS